MANVRTPGGNQKYYTEMSKIELYMSCFALLRQSSSEYRRDRYPPLPAAIRHETLVNITCRTIFGNQSLPSTKKLPFRSDSLL